MGLPHHDAIDHRESRGSPAGDCDREVPAAQRQYKPVLAAGPEATTHNKASDRGYTGVLLVDDTFISGARVQRAASALQLAGARVVATVPIGRYLKPGYSEKAAELWQQATVAPFNFDVCWVHA